MNGGPARIPDKMFAEHIAENDTLFLILQRGKAGHTCYQRLRSRSDASETDLQLCFRMKAIREGQP